MGDRSSEGVSRRISISTSESSTADSSGVRRTSDDEQVEEDEQED